MSTLGGRPWRRVRDAALARSEVCWLCGHPGAGEGDHILSRAYGGATLDPENVLPAHGIRSRCWVCDPAKGKACNQSKGKNAHRPSPHRVQGSRAW